MRLNSKVNIFEADSRLVLQEFEELNDGLLVTTTSVITLDGIPDAQTIATTVLQALNHGWERPLVSNSSFKPEERVSAVLHALSVSDTLDILQLDQQYLRVTVEQSRERDMAIFVSGMNYVDGQSRGDRRYLPHGFSDLELGEAILAMLSYSTHDRL